MHAMAFGVTDTRGRMHTRQPCEVLVVAYLVTCLWEIWTNCLTRNDERHLHV